MADLPKCPECGKAFEPSRYWQKWCGPVCREEYRKRRAQLARDVLKASEEGRSLAVEAGGRR